MADDARGRFLNRLFRKLRFSAERRANLFSPSWCGPDHFPGSRFAPPFPACPHLHHHTDFLLELYAVLARAHGRAGHNKEQHNADYNVLIREASGEASQAQFHALSDICAG